MKYSYVKILSFLFLLLFITCSEKNPVKNYSTPYTENGWNKISYSNITTYDYNFNTEYSFAEVKSDTLETWDGMIDGFFSFYKKLE